MATILGHEGAVALPTGHSAVINTWSATVSRAVHDVTPFGGNIARQLGILDIQGSCGGFMSDGTSTPGFGAGAQAAGHTGSALSLQCQGSTNKIDVDVVIDQIAVSQAATGDATVTFNFLMSDSNGPVFTWTA